MDSLEASKVLIGNQLQTINNSLVHDNNLVHILNDANFYILTMKCLQPNYEEQEAIHTTASQSASAADTSIMIGEFGYELV